MLLIQGLEAQECLTKTPKPQKETIDSLLSASRMMSSMATEDDDYHKLNNSLVMDVKPIQYMDSPTNDRMVKAMEKVESPTMVYDFSDDSSVRLSTAEFDLSDRSHQSLQEIISQSISKIEGVMGEIMDETSASSNLRSMLLKRRSGHTLDTLESDDESDDEDLVLPPPPCLRTCSTMGSTASMNLDSLQAELSHADHEEKQNFKKSVMDNVERISNELEETRKSEEELKQRISKLRGQLAQRRALRNRITNASRIMEHNVNSLPNYLQEEKPKESEEARDEPPEETKGEQRSWVSIFRERRRARLQQEEAAKKEQQSKACRDAVELVAPFRSTAEEDESNSSFLEQQALTSLGRRARFEKRGSWSSFVPASH